MREMTIDLDAVSLRALHWGPKAGPLAVLLHGFPDTAHTWRHLGPRLAEDGWHVVAPFTRGYAPSEVPRDGSGHVAALMDDAVAIHRVLGGDDRAVLVGHDWGAITANALAAHEASPYSRAVTLAVPPFLALQKPQSLRFLPRQMRNSWYIAFNQLPRLPERRAEALVRRLWADWSPGYDASLDLPAVLEAFGTPENRRAIFGYYRNLVRPLPAVPEAYRQWKGAEMRMPIVPTAYLHGDQDGCLDPRLAGLVGPGLPEGSEVHIVPGAGHFLQLEQPELVGELVSAFLASQPGDR